MQGSNAVVSEGHPPRYDGKGAVIPLALWEPMARYFFGTGQREDIFVVSGWEGEVVCVPERLFGPMCQAYYGDGKRYREPEPDEEETDDSAVGGREPPPPETTPTRAPAFKPVGVQVERAARAKAQAASESDAGNDQPADGQAGAG